MALINCPECNHEISDRVSACPHCGFPMVEPTPEAVASQVYLSENTPAVQICDTKKRKQRKIISIICVLVAVSICSAVIALLVIKKNNEKKAEEEASISIYESSVAEQESIQESIQARAEYIENLETLRYEMIASGATAESLCNLTRAVWYDTIYEKFDSDTYKYTKNSSGKFNDDFNTSLAALYSDSETLNKISEIEDSQEYVKSLMKEIQNPPAEFQQCYDTVTELYSAYKLLTDLAISPSGTLNSYTEDSSDYIDTFLEYYEKLDLQIPEQ